MLVHVFNIRNTDISKMLQRFGSNVKNELFYIILNFLLFCLTSRLVSTVKYSEALVSEHNNIITAAIFYVGPVCFSFMKPVYALRIAIGRN